MKFIHTADLHLGLMFKNVSFKEEKGKLRRKELWDSLLRILNYTRDRQVDFLLIAGDLYERDYFTISDITRLRDLFKEFSDINILISAGNHDFIDESSLYKRVEWSENVHIFGYESLSYKEYREKNTRIYGYSWNFMEIRDQDLFKRSLDLDKTWNNILLIHGDVARESVYMALDVKDLENLGFDYIALGHIHKPEAIRHNIVYSGGPEPLDFKETGPRGIVYGEIKDKNLHREFIPFSKRNFHQINLDLSGSMGYLQILETMKSMCEGKQDKDFYRFNLGGFIKEDIILDDIKYELEKDLYHVEIVDSTKADYDIESLESSNYDNIIGKYIREIRSMDIDDDLKRDTLYLGLTALLKERN